MISKATCWMVRDIIRYAIAQLEDSKFSSMEDGIVSGVGEYRCVFRINLFDFDKPHAPIEIMLPNIYNGGFVEFRHYSRSEHHDQFSCYNGGDNFNNGVLRGINPVLGLDFCEDFEGSLFQSELVQGNIPDLAMQSLIIHNFCQDLITERMRLVLNFEDMTNDDKFDENRVRKIHEYFFD